MTASIKCNICGSSDYRILFKEHEAQLHRIVKCTNCGLLYANPQNINSESYSDRVESAEPLTENDSHIIKANNSIRDYKGVLEFINKEKPGKGRLLEVGAHAGVFLNYVRADGWDVVGVEPIKQFAEYAKDHFKLDVMQTTIESSDINDDSFDVVIMMHLIEHINDPASMLTTINRILKPGGMLVVETPTYDTLMFKILGRRERSLSCDQHLYFYTLETLERLLTKCGFEVIKQEKVGRTLSIDRFLWNVGVISKSALVKKTLNSVANVLGLNKLNVHLNMRDMQLAYCTKK